MKKNNLRNLAVIALILISLASYIYLNTTVVGDQNTPQQSIQLDEEDQKEKEIMLPDVRALKTVIEKGRNFLPAS